MRQEAKKNISRINGHKHTKPEKQCNLIKQETQQNPNG